MRSMMRATAEVQGRDPHIAEDFVDPEVDLPEIVAEGKVLTVNSTEALKYDYCEGIVSSLEEALQAAGMVRYVLVVLEVTWIDRPIDIVVNPDGKSDVLGKSATVGGDVGGGRRCKK